MKQSVNSTRARVAALIAGMTLDEKLAQLVGVWVDSGGGPGAEVAPLQDAMETTTSRSRSSHATGWARSRASTARRRSTRSRVHPAPRKAALARRAHPDRDPGDRPRGVPDGPAGLAGDDFPAPLSWGASFDPALVQEIGRAIGSTMASLGVHQGLAPVLDVVRDARWGRVEECISEDPYVVGSIGTSYVRGLQEAGIVATLKHFVGYSASRAGRNLAPVHAGPRELTDVLLIPFEMAVLDGHVRSVMHSYAEIDGLPAAADRSLLTGMLRDRWGFDGVVVSDYFGVAFLASLHGVAADLGDAAAQALDAGVDVELPTGNAYRAPLADAIRAGRIDEALVDIALERVLRQKAELGLLDATFDGPAPEIGSLDPAEHRAIAKRLAEEAVVLLANDGMLPLAGPRGSRSSAPTPTGPRPCSAATRSRTTCSTTTRTCRSASTRRPCWTRSPPSSRRRDRLRPGLRRRRPGSLGLRAGRRGRPGRGRCVRRGRRPGRPLRTRHVGRRLRHRQPRAAGGAARARRGGPRHRDARRAGPVTGRPYAVGWALDRCAAVVQAFFPGEEGAAAIAGVISGRVNPPAASRSASRAPRVRSRTPTCIRRSADRRRCPTSIRPVRPFGFGLSYTTSSASTWSRFPHGADRRADRGERARREHGDARRRRRRPALRARPRGLDHAASGAAARICASAARAGGGGRRPVHRADGAGRVLRSRPRPRRRAGSLELWVGGSCAERDVTTSVELVGERHRIDAADARWVDVVVERAR